MIGYLLAIIPLYVFVFLPISSHFLEPIPNGQVRTRFSSSERSSAFDASWVAFESPDFNTSTCSSHKYQTYIISPEPLVIYIENFLSPEESDHLVKEAYVRPFSTINKHNLPYLTPTHQLHEVRSLRRLPRCRKQNRPVCSSLGCGGA